ncbi:MAG TPA: acetoacetate decarboxylase family protein [Candidatus Kryptonia bacterium]|nr:acetoacetate decarboxylase family protein [Candidatus Kryptonia bacterium]
MSEHSAAVAEIPGRSGEYVIQGKTVRLPVEVRDATSMSAMFVVPALGVRRLIPAPGLYVPELLPGRTLCVVAAIEYRDNDLGVYNEVSIAFFVKHGGPPPTPLFGLLSGFQRGQIGAYIHRLPVTTSFSRDAGRDIWGFPKTVDEIEFRDEGAQRSCRWVADGTHVLTFSLPRGGRRQMKDMPQDAYAWRDGVLRKTPSVMGGEGSSMRLGGATLMLGAHPIADELRGIGLPRRALMSTWVDHMHASFQAPIELERTI